MAFLFTIILALSAGMLGYFLVDLSRQDFLHETEAAIDTEIRMLVSLQTTQSGNLSAYIAQRTQDDRAIRFRFEDEQGHKIAGTIDPMPSEVAKITEGVLRFGLAGEQGSESFAAKIHTFEDGNRIIVARNIHDLLKRYETMKLMSWLIMGLMACVVLVSFGISFFVVSRIHRIAHLAQTIVETGDLSQRLVIDSRWDDLSTLSEILNGFLDKIETLMHSAREVSNHIAHDLRTPLSGLRSDIEALKGQPVTESAIDHLLAEADRILAIFHALLRIANIERGKAPPLVKDIDLATILRDVIELYEPVAEDKHIRLLNNHARDVKIRGDSDLVFQLFANVLDNAIKFSPEHSDIQITTTSGPEGLCVAIHDQGQGIPDHEKDKVFRHFYRGDLSRSTQGHGLGLSLVQAIAHQHQARIELCDGQPGLEVKIYFQPYQKFRIA